VKHQRIRPSDRVRDEIFVRQKGKCYRCLQPLDPYWFEVDHNIALENYGCNCVENLNALDGRCHAIKSFFDKDGGISYEQMTGRSRYFLGGPKCSSRITHPSQLHPACLPLTYHHTQRLQVKVEELQSVVQVQKAMREPSEVVVYNRTSFRKLINAASDGHKESPPEAVPVCWSPRRLPTRVTLIVHRPNDFGLLTKNVVNTLPPLLHPPILHSKQPMKHFHGKLVLIVNRDVSFPRTSSCGNKLSSVESHPRPTEANLVEVIG
jgi:hypothetical protein